jgi:hypothetical protein
MANRRQFNKNGYKGISKKPCGKYQVLLWDGNTKTLLNIGTFVNKEEAARAYDAAATEKNGEFAALNFPEN